ncbi:MAG: hypothetical protein WCG25_04445 [bacterium]
MSKIFTIPLSASTSIISQSFRIFVQNLVPIIHGFHISRLIMAAWQVIHHSSVIIALAFFIRGTYSGLVIHVTNIFHSINVWNIF